MPGSSHFSDRSRKKRYRFGLFLPSFLLAISFYVVSSLQQETRISAPRAIHLFDVTAPSALCREGSRTAPEWRDQAGSSSMAIADNILLVV